MQSHQLRPLVISKRPYEDLLLDIYASKSWPEIAEGFIGQRINLGNGYNLEEFTGITIVAYSEKDRVLGAITSNIYKQEMDAIRYPRTLPIDESRRLSSFLMLNELNYRHLAGNKYINEYWRNAKSPRQKVALIIRSWLAEVAHKNLPLSKFQEALGAMNDLPKYRYHYRTWQIANLVKYKPDADTTASPSEIIIGLLKHFLKHNTVVVLGNSPEEPLFKDGLVYKHHIAFAKNEDEPNRKYHKGIQDDRRKREEKAQQEAINRISVVGETMLDQIPNIKYSWHSISDEKLSELLFQHPTSHLAVALKVSDSAIGKRCRERNITKPPRGYWAKQRRKNKG